MTHSDLLTLVAKEAINTFNILASNNRDSVSLNGSGSGLPKSLPTLSGGLHRAAVAMKRVQSTLGHFLKSLDGSTAWEHYGHCLELHDERKAGDK